MSPWHPSASHAFSRAAVSGAASAGAMPKAAKPWARAVASRRCSSEGRVSESIAALYDKAACVPYILSAIEDQHLTEFSVEARGLTKYFEGDRKSTRLNSSH